MNHGGASVEGWARHEKVWMGILSFFFFFLIFLPFLGPLPQHMEVPRLGVQSEL